MVNLNNLSYEHDSEFAEYSRSGTKNSYGSRMLGDLWAARNGKRFGSCLVRPVFRNIEEAIIEQIKKSDVVIGCVAWLTNDSILKALSETKGCQFVVQVEDWLRPDLGDYSMQRQRELIESLRGLDNYDIPGMLNVGSYIDIAPIRIAGVPKNRDRNQPRMHHKFALFGNLENYEETDLGANVHFYGGTVFHTVFTGSFNWTRNAANSLENGVFMQSPDIIDAYSREYFEILLTSRTITEEWWGESYAWDADYAYSLREGT